MRRRLSDVVPFRLKVCVGFRTDGPRELHHCTVDTKARHSGKGQQRMKDFYVVLSAARARGDLA
jgi:hypothetical protein